MTSLLHAVMVAALASNGAADPPPMPLAERFDVFGLQVCLGKLDDAERCDVHLFAPQASSESAKPASKPVMTRTASATPSTTATSSTTAMSSTTATPSTSTTAATPSGEHRAAPKKIEPFELSLLGRTVCLGHVTGDASCDVTLFPRPREEATG